MCCAPPWPPGRVPLGAVFLCRCCCVLSVPSPNPVIVFLQPCDVSGAVLDTCEGEFQGKPAPAAPTAGLARPASRPWPPSLPCPDSACDMDHPHGRLSFTRRFAGLTGLFLAFHEKESRHPHSARPLAALVLGGCWSTHCLWPPQQHSGSRLSQPGKPTGTWSVTTPTKLPSRPVPVWTDGQLIPIQVSKMLWSPPPTRRCIEAGSREMHWPP